MLHLTTKHKQNNNFYLKYTHVSYRNNKCVHKNVINTRS